MIDLTDKYDCLKAHAQNKNILILSKRDNPIKRFDGKRVSYELQYKNTSKEITNDKDESWVCVSSSEITYWSKKELLENNAFNAENLFDCFNLF